MNDIGPAMIPELVEKMKRGGLQQRRKAAIALGMIPDAVPELLALLVAEDSRVRFYSLQALSLLGDQAAAALPVLLGSLDDERRREQALAGLAALGPAARPAVPRLLRLLRTADEGSRCQVIAALAAVGTRARRAVPALSAILEDEAEAPLVRQQSARSLARLGAAGARALAAAVRRSPDAGRLLGELGPAAPEVVRALGDGLRHEAWHVRCLAAETMGGLPA